MSTPMERNACSLLMGPRFRGRRSMPSSRRSWTKKTLLSVLKMVVFEPTSCVSDRFHFSFAKTSLLDASWSSKIGAQGLLHRGTGGRPRVFLRMLMFLPFQGSLLRGPECPKEAPRANLEWFQACPEVPNLARFWLSKIILQQHQVVGRWSGDAPKRGSASFRDQQSVQVVGRPKQWISDAFMLERYCKHLKLVIQKQILPMIV